MQHKKTTTIGMHEYKCMRRGGALFLFIVDGKLQRSVASSVRWCIAAPSLVNLITGPPAGTSNMDPHIAQR